MEDSEIMSLFHSGNKEQAFNILMRKYQQRIYWHVRRLVCDHDDANDIVQNAFVKVWHSLPDFREEAKMFTWLYRIATNESLTFLKKKKLRQYLSLSDYSRSIENSIEADPYFNGDKLQIDFQKAISKLPPKQRNVFLFRYFDEMKYEQISEITGISVGSLKASYHHAYEKIKTDLELIKNS